MKPERLEKAAALVRKVKHVFLATADLHGWPHLTAAGRLVLTPERRLMVSDWFCPGAVANLAVNPRLSISWCGTPRRTMAIRSWVRWRRLWDLGILDGYSSAVEARTRFPQVERQLLVHVDRVIEFKSLPHSDVEE